MEDVAGEGREARLLRLPCFVTPEQFTRSSMSQMSVALWTKEAMNQVRRIKIKIID
jgi:hypothetical protein